MAKAKAPQPSRVARLDLGGIRKLKASHRYISEAIRDSGKSIVELMSDPFNGYRWLLRALLIPAWPTQGPVLTLDLVSKMIDDYIDEGHSLNDLAKAMGEPLKPYVRVEVTPEKDEDDDPNSAAPHSGAEPGRD